MKYEIKAEDLGELLTRKARAANRETIKYYGSGQPDLKSRTSFLSQLALIRDLEIPVEVCTDEEAGKELYTGITIGIAKYDI